MRVSEIRVKRIRVNQGLVVFDALHFTIMTSEGVPIAKFTKFRTFGFSLGLRPKA